MRLSRTDLVAPVLAIVVGGVIGVSLSSRLLSRSDDVPAPDPAVLSATQEAVRLEEQRTIARIRYLIEQRKIEATAESATRVEARVGTVTGQITDVQSRQPIAAVQVFIRSLDLGGLTQQNGRYLLQNVPSGTYTLTVARIGYRTTEVQITVGSGKTVELNFAVAEEAPQLEPMVVTRPRVQRRPISTDAEIVDPAAIAAQVTSMQQVLTEWTDGNQPLIYVDGILVGDPFSHPADLGNLDPDDVESLEVLSPAAAVARYGPRASAGVVQIRFKRGRPQR